MVRFGLGSYEESALSHWAPRQFADVVGGHGEPLEIDDDMDEEMKDRVMDARAERERTVALPGDSDHFAGMLIIGNSGTDTQIIRDYFAKYRPDWVSRLTLGGEDEPTPVAQWEAELRLSGPPRLWPQGPNFDPGHLANPIQLEPPNRLGHTPIIANPRVSQLPLTSPDFVGAESLTLSQAKQEYLDFQRARFGDGRSEEDAGLLVDFLIDFVGNKPLSALTREDFLSFEKALAETPNRTGIPREHAGSLMARYQYQMANGKIGLKPMSAKRFGVWHLCLNQFFKWLREKGFYCGLEYKFQLVPKNAAESGERDAWTDDEILTLFTLPLFTGCE